MNKLTEELKKGLKETKDKKVTKIDLEELEKKINNYKWYDSLYWWINYGIWQRLSEIPLNIKSFFQRGIRGWADSDTWGFDAYLSKVIYEGLVHLKKYKQGYPITIQPKIVNDPNKDIDYDLNEKNWNSIMDQMIYAFNLANEIGIGNREHYLPKLENKFKRKFKCLTREEDRKVKLGFSLFIKYFYNLWD